MSSDEVLEPSESESSEKREDEMDVVHDVAGKEENDTSGSPDPSEPAKASHHEDQHEEIIMPFYTTPKQRQRWGDNQMPPHTEWGDIFFDLFYVAA